MPKSMPVDFLRISIIKQLTNVSDDKFLWDNLSIQTCWTLCTCAFDVYIMVSTVHLSSKYSIPFIYQISKENKNRLIYNDLLHTQKYPTIFDHACKKLKSCQSKKIGVD